MSAVRHPLAYAAIIGLLLAAGQAGAQTKSPQDIAAELEKTRGVKVLKLQETQVDGRMAYVVSVMNTGGDSNSAFQVAQILVDAQTGEPLPTYRHGPTGFEQVAGPDFKPAHEADGEALRRLTFGGP